MKIPLAYTIVAVVILQGSTSAQDYLVQRLSDVYVRTTTSSALGGGYLYFTAIGDHGKDLFRTDGFVATEFSLNGDLDSFPYGLVFHDGNMFFSASDAGRRDLYQVNTDGEVVLVHTTGIPDPSVREVAQAHDTLYFSANGPMGQELYRLNGLTAELAADLVPGPESSDVHVEVAFGDYVYLSLGYDAASATPDDEFWRIGPTGLESFVNQYSCPCSVIGDALYLQASRSIDAELVRIDRSTGQITEIDITPVQASASMPKQGDNWLFVRIRETPDEVHFYRINEAVSERVGPGDLQVRDWEVLGDRILFFADNPTSARDDLYVLDGDSLSEIDLDPNIPAYAQQSGLHVFDGWIYTTKGENVYRTNGDRSELVLKTDDLMGSWFEYDGQLFIPFYDGASYRLYHTDGHDSNILSIPIRPVWVMFEQLGDSLLFFGSEAPNPGSELYRIIRSDSPDRVDFNRNGILDAGDVDYLTRAIHAGETSEALDLNQDLIFDDDDRSMFLREFAHVPFGDATFDGVFNSQDVVAVLQSGEYEDIVHENSTWTTGDWDGDRDFTSSDFVRAFVDGKYESEFGTGSGSVPEPNGWLLGTLMAAWLLRVSRWTNTGSAPYAPNAV